MPGADPLGLYRPRAFAADDAEIEAFIDRYPFALIVGPDPHISHAPVTRDVDGCLCFHLARANPHGAALAALDASTGVTLVFTGPHAYISPLWYEDAPAVPTWNYTAVHVRGPVREETGERAVHAELGRLVNRFESDAAITQVVTEEHIDKLQHHIRAFRVTPEHRVGKFKLSQNRPADQVERVIAALQSGPSEAQALAEFMRRGPAGEP